MRRIPALVPTLVLCAALPAAAQLVQGGADMPERGRRRTRTTTDGQMVGEERADGGRGDLLGSQMLRGEP